MDAFERLRNDGLYARQVTCLRGRIAGGAAAIVAPCKYHKSYAVLHVVLNRIVDRDNVAVWE